MAVLNARLGEKGSGMYIQFVGFRDGACSRVYRFDVIFNRETREFTVQVQAEMFGPARLKVQDGPSICFERLRRELQNETLNLRARSDLNVGDGDVREYLERQSPRKLVANHAPSYE